ncbi:hypothetical protein [Prosthecodimorpha staleyi]|uniref:Uncharacterized protein n=1 Tax=Prosthecodimorpha staleyi TaxID=2840188 RepID=A0A947GBL5_9HYPH|nr:hypothetical protein [Prosthecodimorpha staleyi]MBT9288812.1 hypothetical protein [Prosthecodimorpha staleyi]
MSNVTRLPFERGPDEGNGGGSSGGPQDPMLEKRIENLEVEVREIRNTTSRLEILLTEIRANLANVATRDDIQNIRTDTAKSREDLARIQGRLENMPSVWQMITVILGSQIALAGLLFTAIKFGIK